MLKRVLYVWALLLYVIVVAAFPSLASGNSDVTIELNGKPVKGDVRPYIDDNSRTMVPVRFISEAIGAAVGWDEKERRVTVSRGSLDVELFIDQKTVLVNGEEKEMDTVAVIREGRTMVPLRFLLETFGLEVEWDGETRTVSLTKLISPEAPKSGLANVSGSTVNIRPGPGTDFEPVIARVSRGDQLTLLGKTGDWYQVRLSAAHNEKNGWIAGWLVELEEKESSPEEPPSEKHPEKPAPEEKELDQPPPAFSGDLTQFADSRSALVMKDSVNVRASSGVEAPVIDKVAYGDWLEITGERDRWYQVRLDDGRTGWIAAWLVATRYEPPGAEKNPALNENTAGPLLGSWSDDVVPPNPGEEKNEEENKKKDLPVVTDIEVFNSQEGVTLRVSANSHLSLPKVVRVTDPDRLAFDFPGLLAGKENDYIAPIQVDSHPVDRIRASQFNDQTVRMVADLQEHIVHAVTRKNDGKTVEITLKPAFPLDNTIVIDPGHATRNSSGGTDPGAVGPTGLNERDVNTSVSHKLGEILLKEGYPVVFVREQDTGITLLERSGVANQSGGVFVSVHANAHPDRSVAGTMTFYPGTRGGGSREFIATSKELAGYVQQEMVDLLKRSDKGVRQANFSVLRNTHIPAILVEIAFVSNPEEEKLLAREDFQNKAAVAIARGIQKYLRANQ